MKEIMLMLFHPIASANVKNEDKDYIFPEPADPEQYKRRWAELEILRNVLQEMGFVFRERRDWNEGIGFSCDGCNWQGKCYGEIMSLSSHNLMLLETRVAEIVALRKQALAKLTPAEQMALGLLAQK